MKKIEIIKELNKEVGLFDENEEENDLGELYLTSIEFKSAEEVLKEIKKLKASLEKSIRFYKDKIKRNENGNYIELPYKSVLKGKTFNYDGDLIFLCSKEILISDCYFAKKGAI